MWYHPAGFFLTGRDVIGAWNGGNNQPGATASRNRPTSNRQPMALPAPLEREVGSERL